MSDLPVYKTPDNMRIYAIGDIHGHASLLDKMHQAISKDLLREAPEKAHIVYMGDYIDRGPDSKGVIDRLIERRDRGDGVPKTFLKGNHESGMYEFMQYPETAAWLNWGGIETLSSYDVRFEYPEAITASEKEQAMQAMHLTIPEEHFEFIDNLELSLTLGDYMFAHAGVDPFKHIYEQTENDLTRIRQPFLSWHKDPLYKPLAKRIVHGHTISEEPIIRPHRIGVDTGAYESGVLTAAVLEGEDVRFLQVSNN